MNTIKECPERVKLTNKEMAFQFEYDLTDEQISLIEESNGEISDDHITNKAGFDEIEEQLGKHFKICKHPECVQILKNREGLN